MTSPAPATAPVRTRKAVVPPSKINKDMSVFDYLKNCQPPLDRKIIDIACSQSNVPADLREDAAQEISLMWATMKPDTVKYKPGQIAAYAHQMARHAALRLRRELGATVRLPGSAFRKRKDGTGYVTPGVLASALDWAELENWYQSEDSPDGFGVSGHLPSEEVRDIARALEEGTPADDSDDALVAARIAVLGAHKDALSPGQYAIMKDLIEGATLEEVGRRHGTRRGLIMREIAVATSILGAVLEVPPENPVKQPEKNAAATA
jgi:hypothetical protein